MNASLLVVIAALIVVAVVFGVCVYTQQGQIAVKQVANGTPLINPKPQVPGPVSRGENQLCNMVE